MMVDEQSGRPNEGGSMAHVMVDAAGCMSSEVDSSVIIIADHCPASLWKPYWCLDHFEIKANLYESDISSVWRALDRRSGITVAIKAYKRAALNEMERHQVAREIWLHAQLNHPAIIALYAAWKDVDYIYLVLEWADEGNVWSFMSVSGGRLEERHAVRLVMEPVLSALAYIHNLGMIHRDVKPENILMTNSLQIKLADFGLSIHSLYEVANTRLGTIDYLAPEILNCPVKAHPQDNKVNPQQWYDNKVDCWSMGVLAFELLAGKAPFQGGTPQETLDNIRMQRIDLPPELSPGAADFISQALNRDPQQRPTMEQLLHHPWILSYKQSVKQVRPQVRHGRWASYHGCMSSDEEEVAPAAVFDRGNATRAQQGDLPVANPDPMVMMVDNPPGLYHQHQHQNCGGHSMPAPNHCTSECFGLDFELATRAAAYRSARQGLASQSESMAPGMQLPPSGHFHQSQTPASIDDWNCMAAALQTPLAPEPQPAGLDPGSFATGSHSTISTSAGREVANQVSATHPMAVPLQGDAAS